MAKNTSKDTNHAIVHTTNQALRLEDLAMSSDSAVVYTTEEEWIAACKRGERLAQNWLYEQHAGKMIYVCMRYLRDKDDAEDAMHDAFVKVFANMHKFRGEAKVGTWITRIMVNTSINKIRKAAKEGIKKDVDKVHLADEDDQTDMIEAPDKMDAQTVLKMILDLPLGYRTVLSLYALDGYSHNEIAKELGISEGTSKSQLAKARRMLKRRIEDRK